MDGMHGNDRDRDEVYSERVRAGKRTYFFDVRETRGSDFYITITESKRRFNDRGYEKHKIFLYKEDFNKFLNALSGAIDHVKTELLPDYDYAEFDRDDDYYENREDAPAATEESGQESFSEDANDETSDELSTTWND